jgi:malate/lactate dehydrogenase
MASCFIAQSAPFNPEVVSIVSPTVEAGAEVGKAMGAAAAELGAGLATACVVTAAFLQPTAVNSTGSTISVNVLQGILTGSLSPWQADAKKPALYLVFEHVFAHRRIPE